MTDQLDNYRSGFLNVGDGQTVFWESWGRVTGKPALFLHGGPGSGCGQTAKQFFDQSAYRVVQFDQRGCGGSTPHASKTPVDLSTNTTWHLLADIEILRDHLGIDRWLVLGGSWGSTLALAYAERFPQRVTAVVLFSVTMTTAEEIEWITGGVGMFFPDAYARFRDGAGSADSLDIVRAYHRLLMDPDPAIHEQAASDWCAWEAAVVAMSAKDDPHPRYQDPSFRLGFARLVTHYWGHKAWLDDDGVLLRQADQLADIPGILIHGRLDIGSPLITAWKVHKVWPRSELLIVDRAGHGSGQSGMSSAIREATDRLSRA